MQPAYSTQKKAGVITLRLREKKNKELTFT